MRVVFYILIFVPLLTNGQTIVISDSSTTKIDFHKIKDTITFRKIDTTEHFEIVQYSGQPQDPPARYVVYFYKSDNKTKENDFWFFGQSCLFTPILNYKRQELFDYCKKNADNKNSEK
jgi:hypothetical protein